jgi:cold shock protein
VTTTGTVREWHDDEGWGVIDAAETPGGCWTHFSVVLVPGYRSLAAGRAVTFAYEPAQQDGFAFRATRVDP